MFSCVLYVSNETLNTEKINVKRSKIKIALEAEGVQGLDGYINVHRFPMFQKKISYGKNDFPGILNYVKEM